MKLNKIFLLRLFLFVLFSLVIPISYVCFEFNIFNQVSKISSSINIFGILVILISIFFVFYIVKTIDSIKKYSMFFQVIKGIFKVLLPMIAIFFVFNYISNNILSTIITNAKQSIALIKNFTKALILCIVCEAIAIPLNPIPKWKYENEIDFFENIFNKKKGE